MPLRKRPVRALLDLVFGQARVPGGGPRWITILPWSYFCHMCDSGGDPIAVASLRRAQPGERLIVCTPCEWRHDFHDLDLSTDEQEHLEATVRQHLAGQPPARTGRFAFSRFGFDRRGRGPTGRHGGVVAFRRLPARAWSSMGDVMLDEEFVPAHLVVAGWRHDLSMPLSLEVKPRWSRSEHWSMDPAVRRIRRKALAANSWSVRCFAQDR